MKYFLIALPVFFLPASSFAASLSFTPVSSAVAPGQRFSVALYVDPENATIYTVRANLSFDPSLLQLLNFSFTQNWISLPEPGYDLIDNSNGRVAKTAGVPGGMTHETELGVATFVAKKVGAASITTTRDSFALDASSTNDMSGEAIASVQIGAGVAPAPIMSAPAAVLATSAPQAPVTPPSPLASTTPAPANLQSASALSGFDEALTLGTGNPLATAFLTVCGILLLAAFFRLLRYAGR